mmetsp:Transcript_18262/g.30927  ORF Transcript_18262/g.30927 Transcript_18262/m.30927 type:complete len:238 (-) Transcript_18262:1641-2354(-)
MMMRLLVAFLSLSLSSAFSVQPTKTGSEAVSTRADFVSKTCGAILSSMLMPTSALADEETEIIKPSPSIKACDRDAKNCVSSANIKQIDLYSPPWTFEVSPDEAFARIKGVLKSDDYHYAIKEIDDEARYIRAYVLRREADQDEVEFLVKGDDKVVVFKSSERKEGGLPDLGVNRKRIDDVRKRGAVFELMGGGATADSYDGGGAAARGNNAFGQLKAFYGLQKGEGFQSVFEEEDD